jgi:hypothetical protein
VTSGATAGYWRFAKDAGATATQVQTDAYIDLAAATGDLAARAAQLTDRFDQSANEAQELHAETLHHALTALTMDLERESLGELLDELSGTFGFSWSTLARCLRVTPTAVRKWRRGDEPSAENKQRAAYTLAFARKLQEIDVRLLDVGYWLEAPMSAETTLTRADLYRSGAAVDLLRMARSSVRVGPDNLRPDQVLDAHVPDWRRTHARDDRFAVQWDDDGMPSIVVDEPGG